MAVSYEPVELSEAIGVVREQLIKAHAAAAARAIAADDMPVTAEDLTFVVGTVTVEFMGEVTKTVGAGGGAKFWVVNADAKGERASSTSQKVTVELTPQSLDGKNYTVNDGAITPPRH